MLKYIYLDLDPHFVDNVGLDQLGFTRGARIQIARLSATLNYNNTRELLSKLSDQKNILRLKNDYKCDLGILSEIIFKSEIMFKYYNQRCECNSLNMER